MKVTTEIQIQLTLEHNLTDEKFKRLFDSDYGILDKYCSITFENWLTDSLIEDHEVVNHNFVIKNFVRD